MLESRSGRTFPPSGVMLTHPINQPHQHVNPQYIRSQNILILFFEWFITTMHFPIIILLGCALQISKINALNILKTTTTPNGFNSAAMGWNSFGLQAISPTISGWSPLEHSKVLE